MYIHFHLTDQGFGPLAMLLKQIAIQEMGHVELLAERILFLKGDVVMVPAGPVEKIVEPEPILLKAMAMEEDGIRSYNQAAIECGAKADSASKQLFERLVNDEEGHFGQFEKQCDQHQEVRPELPGPSVLRRRRVPRGRGAGHGVAKASSTRRCM